MIGSWWRSCIALALVACIDEPPSCEAMVCELVPACSPLTTGAASIFGQVALRKRGAS